MFLRMFSDSEYYFIQGGDSAKYLVLANNFPYHTAYNNQLYIVHPPLYPYLIHFVSFFVEDYLAGILISLISAAITFFIVYKLVILISNSRYVALGTLLLFSLSGIFISISTKVGKESFSVMLSLSSIYFLIVFLKKGKGKNIWLSAFFGALLGVTTDHVVLLIPSLILSYVVFWNKNTLWRATIPIISATLSYSFWIFVRAYTYMTHEFYNVGLDGTIANVSNWGLKQLVSPMFFSEIQNYVPFGFNFQPLHYIYPISYMLNLVVAPWPAGLRFSNLGILFSTNYALQLIIYTTLTMAAIYGTYKIIKSFFKKGIKNNGMLLSLILFTIFIFPLSQEFISTRFTVTAIIFLFIIINYGFFQLAKTFNVLRLYKLYIIVLISIVIVYMPFFYYSNNHFILSKEKLVEAPKTGEFINQLPKDGIMSQIGYGQEIMYLTDKRVMALPITPNYMFLIDKYNISYVLYGEFWSEPFENYTGHMFNYDTIKYIREHSEKFKLLNVIEETYPVKINGENKKDHIYIYEVMSN